MTLYSVDRVEGELVVLTSEQYGDVIVAKNRFDGEPREGDCFTERAGRYERSERSTKALRDEVNSLLDELLKKHL